MFHLLMITIYMHYIIIIDAYVLNILYLCNMYKVYLIPFYIFAEFMYTFFNLYYVTYYYVAWFDRLLDNV